MKECIQPYYIKNGNILDCQSFDLKLINEGKSVYEVIRLSGTKLLFLRDHLDRLYKSLDLACITPWIDGKDISGQLEELINKNNAREGNLKIVMNSRPGSGNHFLAYFVAHRYPSEKDYKNGVKVILFPFERKDPNTKVWRPEFRAKVAEELQKCQAFEALLLDSEECLPEASKANIFAVKGNNIITAPEEFILPGITRKYVLEICKEMGISVHKRKISLNEIPDLDGLFLTGTSLHVLPVNSVNNIRLSTDNRIMKKLMKKFENILFNHLR
ncbi:aminotransferase class IV [Bacteroidota bacterium]